MSDNWGGDQVWQWCLTTEVGVRSGNGAFGNWGGGLGLAMVPDNWDGGQVWQWCLTTGVGSGLAMMPDNWSGGQVWQWCWVTFSARVYYQLGLYQGARVSGNGAG